MRQHQAEFLELGEKGFAGLPFRGDLNRVKDHASFTVKRAGRGVKEILVLLGGNATEKKRLDVDWSKTRDPLKPLETAGEMRGVCRLTAAVTGKKKRIRHNGKNGRAPKRETQTQHEEKSSHRVEAQMSVTGFLRGAARPG